MEELKESPGFPSAERVMKGPVAAIECVQEIPCDACGSICPHNAIKLDSLNSLPDLIEDECTGCGACIPFCPGLAIFLIDYHFSREEAAISFPYELLPIPETGETVEPTDRLGRVIGKARVVRVLKRDNFNGTVVLTIAIPKNLAQRIRGIERPRVCESSE